MKISDKNRKNRTLLIGLLLGAAAFFGVAGAQNHAVQRPIEDFTSSQGTTIGFTPPVADQIGWLTPASQSDGKFALFDYAGKANEYLISQGLPSLGTTMSGKVTERPLADGRAEVTVILHTKNALTWTIALDPQGPSDQFNSNPPLFGFRAPDIVADPLNNQPALGNSDLQVVFKNTALGAPLPDLVACFILGTCPAEIELVSISFRGTATGALHESAGLGPEGTPGRCFVVQTGILYRSSFKGATADGFPAEIVELRRVGK
jgi:hypothetical protein